MQAKQRGRRGIKNKNFYTLGHYEEDDPDAPGEEDEENLNKIT